MATRSHEASDLAIDASPLRQQAQFQQAFWQGLTARDENRAIFLITEQQKVVYATPRALQLIHENYDLTLSQHVLRCEQPGDDARLRQAIAIAVRPAAPVTGAVRVSRRSGRSPLLVTIHPLTIDRGMAMALDAAALLTITDPLEARRTEPVVWRSLFDLTAREVNLAELLTLGHSIESAAASLQIAIPTARTHLRSIFQKTGTDRQSSLVQLLGRLT